MIKSRFLTLPWPKYFLAIYLITYCFTLSMWGLDDDNLLKIYTSQVWAGKNSLYQSSLMYLDQEDKSGENFAIATWFEFPELQKYQVLISLFAWLERPIAVFIAFALTSFGVSSLTAFGAAISVLIFSLFLLPNIVLLTGIVLSAQSLKRNMQSLLLSFIIAFILVQVSIQVYFTEFLQSDRSCFLIGERVGESVIPGASVSMVSIKCAVLTSFFPGVRYFPIGMDARQIAIFATILILVGFKFDLKSFSLRTLALLPWIHVGVGSIAYFVLIIILLLIQRKIVNVHLVGIFLLNFFFLIAFQFTGNSIVVKTSNISSYLTIPLTFALIISPQILLSRYLKKVVSIELVTEGIRNRKWLWTFSYLVFFAVLTLYILILSILSKFQVNVSQNNFTYLFTPLEPRFWPIHSSLFLLAFIEIIYNLIRRQSRRPNPFVDCNASPKSKSFSKKKHSRKDKIENSRQKFPWISFHENQIRLAIGGVMYLMPLALVLIGLAVTKEETKPPELLRPLQIFSIPLGASISLGEDLRRTDRISSIESWGHQRVAWAWMIYCDLLQSHGFQTSQLSQDDSRVSIENTQEIDKFCHRLELLTR